MDETKITLTAAERRELDWLLSEGIKASLHPWRRDVFASIRAKLLSATERRVA